MDETELGVVVSPRDWAERLHRFTVDHGGARVRARVLRPEDAMAEDYQVLIIDDVTSFLNLRLVQQVQSSGRRVLGVYDGAEAGDGRRRLLDLGVDEVIDASSSPDQFLQVIGSLDVAFMERVSIDIPEDADALPVDSDGKRGRLVVVAGASGGVGALEVALEMAKQVHDSGQSVVLVDGNNVAPSLTQRLGLAVHPNLRTAVDALLHRPDRLASTMLRFGGLEMVGGLSNPKDWVEVRDGDVVELAVALRSTGTHVVVKIDNHIEDLSYYGGIGRYSLGRSLIQASDEIVLVGVGTPVGVARLLEWVAEARPIMGGVPVYMVINRVLKSSYQQGEIRQEITRTFAPHLFTSVGDDKRVSDAAWAGEFVKPGPFTKALTGMASSLFALTPSRGS